MSTERQARISRLGRELATTLARADAIEEKLVAEMRAERDEDDTSYETIARLTPFGTTRVFRMIKKAESRSS